MGVLLDWETMPSPSSFSRTFSDVHLFIGFAEVTAVAVSWQSWRRLSKHGSTMLLKQT